MRKLVLTLLLFAAACGGGSGSDSGDGSAEPGALDSQESVSGENGQPSEVQDGTTCDLLSSDEVSQAVGRVIIDVTNHSAEDGVVGACSWTFEPLTEGLFEGDSPEFSLQVLRGEEHYENWVLSFPGGEDVSGIGDEAVHRTPGELVFMANGLSAQLATALAFDTGQEDEANAAMEELGRLLIGRI